MRQATEHAGDGTVVVCGGRGRRARSSQAGLADELAIDLAPVFLGQGKRFLGSATDEIVLDDPHVVIQGERVLHLRYRAAPLSAAPRRQPARNLGPVDFARDRRRRRRLRRPPPLGGRRPAA